MRLYLLSAAGAIASGAVLFCYVAVHPVPDEQDLAIANGVVVAVEQMSTDTRPPYDYHAFQLSGSDLTYVFKRRYGDRKRLFETLSTAGEKHVSVSYYVPRLWQWIDTPEQRRASVYALAIDGQTVLAYPKVIRFDRIINAILYAFSLTLLCAGTLMFISAARRDGVKRRRLYRPSV